MGAEKSKYCTCWADRNRVLVKDYGLRISRSCELIKVDDLELEHAFCLPLERSDGARLRRTDPKNITISFCPFCGASLRQKK